MEEYDAQWKLGDLQIILCTPAKLLIVSTITTDIFNSCIYFISA